MKHITTNTIGGYISICNKAGQEIGGLYPASINLVMFKRDRGNFETMEAALVEADKIAALELLAEFGLNPQTVMETMGRVTRAMQRDGVTQELVTVELMQAYMAADQRTQEKLGIAYFTNPEFRDNVRNSVLDLLEAQA